MAKKQSHQKKKSQGATKATKSTSTKPALKKTTRSATARTATPRISFVARLGNSSESATINVTFTSGLGQLTASLFRNGVLINMQSISSSSDIILADVQTGDALAMVGVASGNTRITISVPTSPATPTNLTAGAIHKSYIIL